MARRKNPEAKMSLRGHLGELRKRLFWSALFFAIATVIGWYLFDPVFAALQKPIVDLAEAKGIKMPIVEQVYLVMQGKMHPREIAPHLTHDTDEPQVE